MKVCPFCNAEIPEESIYCLNCASVLNERHVFPAVKEKKEKTVILLTRKKIMSAVAVVLSLVIVISSCLFALHSSRNDTPKTEEKKTTLVPVTEKNGESVTDANGEQVFEVTEITESTTEKQGLLDKLFGKDEGETKNNNASETTTKKQSILDKIFGNDEAVENTTSSTSTEPEATTNAEPSTEATTDKTESSTSTATSSTESTTEITTQPISESNAEYFEYAEYSQNKLHLSITKYNGNDENVVIPATYNGKYIVEIRKETFKDNDKIKTITFADDEDRPYLWINTNCFYNCPNLHTINMPDENLGIVAGFAKKCYSMKTITLKNSQYRFEDGGLYAGNGNSWELRYFCPATVPEIFTIPSWCAGIDSASNFSELTNLRVIYCHEYVSVFPHQTNIPNNLEAIYVDDKNENGYDVNGIAFKYNSSDGKYHCTYPPKNTTKDFTIPDNTYIYGPYINNPYLETLRIELTAELFGPTAIIDKRAFTNLKTIYVKSGHAKEEDIKQDFYGTVYTY